MCLTFLGLPEAVEVISTTGPYRSIILFVRPKKGPRCSQKSRGMLKWGFEDLFVQNLGPAMRDLQIIRANMVLRPDRPAVEKGVKLEQ